MTEPIVQLSGSCSWFGGPADNGVAPDEGLAFLYEVEDAPTLFLAVQPAGTTGLARRLDPRAYYVACRWDYDTTPKDMLRRPVPALVRSRKTGKMFLARPADWGPHSDTGRVADISPGLMDALGITTDDDVEVIYPAPDYVPPEEAEARMVRVNIAAPDDVEVAIYVNGVRLT